MAKSKNKKKAVQVKGRMPEAARYEALKSMCYCPSRRDQIKRERKQGKNLARSGGDGW